MVKRKVMSQYISKDYCQDWNDAINEMEEIRMIVAKTKMKKIPETCKKCSLSIVQRESWTDSFRICAITGSACPMTKSSNGCYGYVKPDNCPLIEVDKYN